MAKRRKLDPTVLHPEAQRLKDFLEAHLIGQKRAIEKVVRAYNYFLSPIWRPEKPILCLMAMGPSGSGKTFLAELLALYFFGSKTSMTKIECENYQERHEIAKLIGAPPGYVGYDEPRNPNPPILSQARVDRFAWNRFFEELHKKDEKYRQLQEELEARISAMMEAKDKDEKKSLADKFSEKRREIEAYVQTKVDKFMSEKHVRGIILLDEIERGNKSLHDFLLEVTSKGRATLGNGDVSNLTHAIIIESSNVGSKQIANLAKGKGVIGLAPPQRKVGKTDKEIYDVAIKEAKKVFGAEYLARHSKVVYHLLTTEQLEIILDRIIGQLSERLREEGFKMEIVISKEVRRFVLNESLDQPESGARLLEDKADKHLNEPIGSLISSRQIFKKDSFLYVDLEREDGEDRIVFSAENGAGERDLAVTDSGDDEQPPPRDRTKMKK